MNLRSVGMTRKHKPSHHNGRLWVSEAKISTPSSEQGESDVDNFLWSWRHHLLWVYTRWSNCKQGGLCWSSLLAAWWLKRPASWKRADWQLHHDCVPTLLSHLIQNSWLNIRSHRYHILPIHWTWPHVTVFYSWRWKCCRRGIGFKTRRR
jgi:hypothetical protein